MRRFAPLAWLLPSAVLILSAFVPLILDVTIQEADWLDALSTLHRSGLVYGRDIVFTYGPWGVLWGNYFPTTFASMCLAWSFFAIASWWAMLRIVQARWRVSMFVQGVILLALVIPLGGDYPVSPDTRLLGLAPLLLLLHYFVDPRPATWPKAMLIVAIAWSGTIKFTYLVEGTLAVAIVTVDQIIARRDLKWFYRPWPMFAFLFAFMVAWATSGQPLGAIAGYLYWSAELLAGYSEAMALWKRGELTDVLICILPAALLLGLITHAAAREHRWRAALLLLGLGALFHIAFRSGFVRHDYHATMTGVHFFAMALVGFAAVWPRLRRANAKIAWLFCLAASAFSWGHSLGEWKDYSLSRQLIGTATNLAAETRELGRLLIGRPSRTGQDWLAHMASPEMKRMLPRLSKSTSVFSSGAATLIANDIKYLPRPTIHAYAAFTPALSNLNARQLAGDSAPQDILFCIDPIDRHLPAIEDSASWLELLRHYRTADKVPPYLALTRRATPRVLEMKRIGEYPISLDQPIQIPVAAPNPDYPMLWAKIDLPTHPAGRLMSQLFKPPLLVILIRTRGGENLAYTLIPAMAAGGFLLGPVVEQAGLFDAMLGDDPDAPQRWRDEMPAAITLHAGTTSDGDWYFSQIGKLTLYGLTVTNHP